VIGEERPAIEEQVVPVPAAQVSANLARLADTVARLRGEVDHAHAVADGRALIELAKGVLMERLHCTPADAARQLETLAERAGLTPLEFAADVVGEAAEDRITEVTQEFLARAEGEDSVAVRLRTAESGVLAAGDTQRVAESILEHALRPLGATAVAVWLAGPDGSLTLAGSAGFSAEEAARWRYVPPGVATPARNALLERDTVWYPTLTGGGLPSIGQHTLAEGGRVAVPTGTGGRIIGVVEMCWPDPLPAEPGRLRRQLEALAELCAHTLDTWDGVVAPVAAAGAGDFLGELVDFVDGLHDPAVLLSPCLEGGRLSDFRIHHANVRFADPGGRPRSRIVGTRLLETYPLAAEESGLLDMIQRVYATGEPFRAESMAVTTLVDQVPLTVLTDISVTRFAGNVLLVSERVSEASGAPEGRRRAPAGRRNPTSRCNRPEPTSGGPAAFRASATSPRDRRSGARCTCARRRRTASTPSGGTCPRGAARRTAPGRTRRDSSSTPA
jgi:hypothetical protein